jgi:hypothetical protein
MENEMGGACSACGGEVHTGFGWGNLRERDHFEDPSVDGSIILRGILQEVEDRGMDWIQFPQDSNRWRSSVNAVINLRVP